MLFDYNSTLCKNAKKEFEENNEIFSNKVKKIEKVIKGLYEQMDDIKELYGLKEDDLEVIKNYRKNLRKTLEDLGSEILWHNTSLNEKILK